MATNCLGNRIDIYCSAKGCKRWLYTSEPPILENPLCDDCKISQLEAEVEMYERHLAPIRAVLGVEFNGEIKAKIGALQVALEKYGRHERGCPMGSWPTKLCSCGFKQALDAARGRVR